MFENSSGFSISSVTTNTYVFDCGSNATITEKAGGLTVTAGPVTPISIMAGLSASGLKTQIRSYTETDSNVLTDAVLENIILNAQYRIFRDVPIDADRKQQLGNLVAGQNLLTLQQDHYLQEEYKSMILQDQKLQELTDGWRKDYTYLQEYQDVTGTSMTKVNLNIMLCLVVVRERLIQHLDV